MEKKSREKTGIERSNDNKLSTFVKFRCDEGDKVRPKQSLWTNRPAISLHYAGGDIENPKYVPFNSRARCLDGGKLDLNRLRADLNPSYEDRVNFAAWLAIVQYDSESGLDEE